MVPDSSILSNCIKFLSLYGRLFSSRNRFESFPPRWKFWFQMKVLFPKASFFSEEKFCIWLDSNNIPTCQIDYRLDPRIYFVECMNFCTCSPLFKLMGQNRYLFWEFPIKFPIIPVTPPQVRQLQYSQTQENCCWTRNNVLNLLPSIPVSWITVKIWLFSPVPVRLVPFRVT